LRKAVTALMPVPVTALMRVPVPAPALMPVAVTMTGTAVTEHVVVVEL
jgi:hypothetical protein